MKATKQNQPILLLLALLLMLFAGTAPARSDQGQSDLVKKLIAAYNNFDYQKCSQLLNAAFQSIDKFSAEDRKNIYLYSAFLAYRNGNITLTKDHFWHLLEVDPTFSPDPITTPPKLVTLFRQTKIEFLENLNQRLQASRLAGGAPLPWRSLLFPGWEQWHRGYRVKGGILSLAGAGALSGLIYSAIQTRRRKDAYQTAGDPATIPSLYREYNRAYRNQFYFSYAFAAIWAVSQADLILWSTPRISVQSRLNRSGTTALLGFQIDF